jgi:LacI family transcriptional regulator
MEEASTVVERLNGYRFALQQAGIPFRPEFVIPVTIEDSHRKPATIYHEAVEHLLNLPEPPTAVFAVHDLMALHLMAALRACGRRVPEDIAIAGFDGIERWKPGEPFLTTCHQPFEVLGMRAANLLLQRIESGTTTAYRHILLEAPLRVHGSTLFKQGARNK